MHRQHESPPLKMREIIPPEEGARSTLSHGERAGGKGPQRAGAKAPYTLSCKERE